LHAQHFTRGDNPSTITWIRDAARDTASVHVLPTGAISKNLEGLELAPIASIVAGRSGRRSPTTANASKITIDAARVEYARMVGVPVLDHCQDYNLVGNGVVNEGEWSTLLGLSGWPAAGEEAMVMRNILLAELCDHHIHCQPHQRGGKCAADSRSAGAGSEDFRRGLSASYRADGCCHSKFRYQLQDEPPLRTQGDIEAIIEGIRDGTLSIFARRSCARTPPFEKEGEFDQAPFGIVGLETELGLFIDILVHKRKAFRSTG